MASTRRPGNRRSTKPWTIEVSAITPCGASATSAGTGRTRGSTRGACTIAMSASRPKASRPSRRRTKFRLLFSTRGNGCAGSSAIGVSSGSMSRRKTPSAHSRWAGVQAAVRRMRMPSADRAGISTLFRKRYWRSTSARARSSAAPMPARMSAVSPRAYITSWWRSAMRTSKNSSRLLLTIVRKRRRSSRGIAGSSASASTRSLKARIPCSRSSRRVLSDGGARRVLCLGFIIWDRKRSGRRRTGALWTSFRDHCDIVVTGRGPTKGSNASRGGRARAGFPGSDRAYFASMQAIGLMPQRPPAESPSRAADMPGLLAAVDLGSNSFRLLIGRVDRTGLGDQIRPIDSLKETVRLAAGLGPDGALDADSRQRGLAALARFGERLRSFAPDAVRVVATSTLRVATNARDFIESAEAALGFPISVISGREEARLIYLGAAHELALDGQDRLVVDIGGGSTECVIGRNYDPLLMESAAVGCVTLTARYFENGTIDRRRMRAARHAAREAFAPHARTYRRQGWSYAVGTSGTAKALAQFAL